MFDIDGSGAIDIDELRECMKELCVPMTEEELQEALDQMDEDGNGTVEFEEFLVWFTADEPIEDPEAQKLADALEKVGIFATGLSVWCGVH